MLFPVSGVETPLWLPPLVAFCVSFVTSMGGVSGAFLLLPFQVSVLGYVTPSVSATNQVFNIVAIPSGVYRYIREGRMVWPLTWAVIVGTLPGVVLGAWIRVRYLPSPRNFKLFAALVLGYIGIRLLQNTIKAKAAAQPAAQTKACASGPLAASFVVENARFSWECVEFEFDGRRYSFKPMGVLALCAVVGLIGGVYGIGGGAIVAPFLVAFYELPVYTVAGAALMGTFLTSVAGVASYHLLAAVYTNMQVAPDWALGALFGLGGVAGMYLGARLQKKVPAKAIKLMLCACILYVAGRYVWEFLTK